LPKAANAATEEGSLELGRKGRRARETAAINELASSLGVKA
jgi:hypothetical protein